MISPRFFSMMTSAAYCKAGATGAECWEHRKKTQVILQSLSPRSRLLLAILASNMWICVRKTIHTITPRYLVSHNKCCASWKTQNMPCGGEYRSIRSHKTVGWIIGSLEKNLLFEEFQKIISMLDSTAWMWINLVVSAFNSLNLSHQVGGIGVNGSTRMHQFWICLCQGLKFHWVTCPAVKGWMSL